MTKFGIGINLALAIMGGVNFIILLYQLVLSLRANYYKVFGARYRAKIVPLVV